MEAWQIELLKIGATAIVAFLLGLGSHWLRQRRREKERGAQFKEYLKKREIEKAPEQEKLQEAEKLTTLLIEHRRHKISPEAFNEFRERILSQVSRNEFEPRNIEEMLEAEEEFFDKVWYGRHKLLESVVNSGRREVDPEIWHRALKHAKEIERKYGKEQLAPCHDFEWGMLSGKLSALRWVLGDEWDMLDT